MNVASGSRSDSDSHEQHWHSFTCPVCGHRDRVRAGSGGERTTCTHCDTRLVLEAATPDEERVAASVDRSASTPETPH